jgi:mannose-6-phosphate isomerase
MSESKPRPIAFHPYLRPQIWGGRRLTRWGKSIPADALIGETWELSPHPFHISQVAAPPEFQGESLHEFWPREAEFLTGRPGHGGLPFPILIKLLDCVNWLSIQVHPNDVLARMEGGEAFGKTEAWYVLHADPDAELIMGLQEDVTAEDLLRFCFPSRPFDESRRAELDSLFVRATPKTGDFILIPPGVVHAARGIVVWELQTPCDMTYRLYDWDRIRADGTHRELHVAKAVNAIDWSNPTAISLPAPGSESSQHQPFVRLMEAPFRVELLRLRQSPFSMNGGEMRVLCGVSGRCDLKYEGGGEGLGPGDLRLIPATLQDLHLSAVSRDASLLVVTPALPSARPEPV